MHKACPGVAALALLAACPATAAQRWEGDPLTAAQRAACQRLPRALVRPVEPRYQAEAMARLQAAPAAALDDAQAAEWIDVDAPPTGALAERLLKDATDAMIERRETSIGEHALKWSPSEQAALDLLRQVSGRHDLLKPVLVRAVAGSQDEGVFDAAACGAGLAVRWLEPGRKPAAPAAVIVFVEQVPQAVQAWRETLPR